MLVPAPPPVGSALVVATGAWPIGRVPTVELVNSVETLAEPEAEQLITLFWLAVGASIILPRIPYGRTLLYPFALLGTWAHEMGHGLAAVLVGGRFRRLEIYPGLGGQAYSSGIRGARTAVVSAGGLLGPALAGGLIIVLGSRQQTAPWVLTGLAVAVALSLLGVVRNLFGWLALGAVAAALAPLALYAPTGARIFLAQLIGIQFCLACWSTLDYMFTRDFRRDGRIIESDTQQIANVLILPYWFWGGVIALISLGVVIASFYLAWMMPAQG